MSEINFSGTVNGPVQAGDGNNMTVYGATSGTGPDQPVADTERTAEALRQAVELLRLVRAEGGQVAGAAESINSELDRAVSDGDAPDRSRIARWLDTVKSGVAVGSGALALVEAIRRAIIGA